jgi:mannose-6-phosphate isomerase-like protein (cupin superfamily)
MNQPASFATLRADDAWVVNAPDGSRVQVLLSLHGGSMATFTLQPGQVSTAVTHRSVEELWLVVAGRGRMWRRDAAREETVAIEPGLCLSVPLGTAFQFRCEGDAPLVAVAATMPPWPGDGEALAIEGPWDAAPGSEVGRHDAPLSAVRASNRDVQMVGIDLQATTEDFFNEFDRAFTTFDGTIVAARYSAPYLAVRADGSSACFASDSAIASYFQQVLDSYHRNGCRSCRHRDLRVVEAGKAAVFSTVTWDLLRDDHSVLKSWQESYNLVLAGTKLKACASLNHAP